MFAYTVYTRLYFSALIDYTSEEMPKWRGYLCAALFFIQSVVQTISINTSLHTAIMTGMRIKIALTAAVFKKV